MLAMKFLVVLALIGLASAVPVSEPLSETDSSEIEWEKSFWNWNKDDNDVRGPHMKCIESQMTVLFRESVSELNEMKDWMSEWKNDVIDAKPEVRTVEFKKGLKVFQKYLKNILGNYDKSVAICRNDDNFSLVDFINKFIDLFLDLDVNVIDAISADLAEEILRAKKLTDKTEQEIECYKESMPKAIECAKTYFSFKIYEEKGVCGINHMKLINCFEDVAHKCSQDAKSEITVVGSVVFRFFYDACHH